MEQYIKDRDAFTKKHPDYRIDKKKYEKITCGNCDEWDAQAKKEKAGFEFAPTKPCYFEGQTQHWQSIVDGNVPFGYTIDINN